MTAEATDHTKYFMTQNLRYRALSRARIPVADPLVLLPADSYCRFDPCFRFGQRRLAVRPILTPVEV